VIHTEELRVLSGCCSPYFRF